MGIFTKQSKLQQTGDFLARAGKSVAKSTKKSVREMSKAEAGLRIAGAVALAAVAYADSRK